MKNFFSPASHRARVWRGFPHLSKFSFHETSVNFVPSGDVVKDIAPQIEVIPLFRNLPFCIEGELGASVHLSTGELVKHYGHNPIEQNNILKLCARENLHAQLLAPARKAIAHGLEFLDSVDPLDRILKGDVIGVIRKNV